MIYIKSKSLVCNKLRTRSSVDYQFSIVLYDSIANLAFPVPCIAGYTPTVALAIIHCCTDATLVREKLKT